MLNFHEESLSLGCIQRREITSHLCHSHVVFSFSSYACRSTMVSKTPINDVRFKQELGYLKYSIAAAHSVDSDIIYEVIHLLARSETYINLYFLR